jgi:hypothetical protein
VIVAASWWLEMSDGSRVVISSTQPMTIETIEEVREHLAIFQSRLRARQARSAFPRAQRDDAQERFDRDRGAAL